MIGQINRRYFATKCFREITCRQRIGSIQPERHIIQGIVVAKARITRIHINNLDNSLFSIAAIPRDRPSAPIVARGKLIYATDIIPINLKL